MFKQIWRSPYLRQSNLLGEAASSYFMKATNQSWAAFPQSFSFMYIFAPHSRTVPTISGLMLIQSLVILFSLWHNSSRVSQDISKYLPSICCLQSPRTYEIQACTCLPTDWHSFPLLLRTRVIDEPRLEAYSVRTSAILPWLVEYNPLYPRGIGPILGRDSAIVSTILSIKNTDLHIYLLRFLGGNIQ